MNEELALERHRVATFLRRVADAIEDAHDDLISEVLIHTAVGVAILKTSAEQVLSHLRD